MSFDLSFLTSDVVIYSALAFIAGTAGVISYSRLSRMKSRDRDRDYHADDSIVEAVVAEYTRRLGDYDRLFSELRVRLDVLEMRAEVRDKSGDISQQSPQSHEIASHAPRVISGVTITQHAPKVLESEGQNGTSDYILKLLAERPRTSREVQQAIGRTREHTARLMKKLHDSGLVSRNTVDKPFTYLITDLGWERLREKAEAAPGVRLT